jgi:hypothetical protein
MIHYEFKTCISDGMELYGFVQEEANGQRVMSTRNARFPQSLLSFLDFDIEQIRLAFQPLSDGVRKVIAEKSREESDRVCQMFAGLTNYHPYFVLLFLDWRYRLDRAWYLGYEFPQNYLQVEYLDEMPDNLERLQRQALDLLTHIWVKDTSDRSVDEKMTAYYLEAEQVEKDVFRFRPQKMSYELMYRQTFAEFLCPDTVYDLIDYHLRECLKREIKMRRCKNCGRLFGGTEYCDRPADERGRTCREIGAFRVWEKSKSTDEPFKVFRREYKKRFAWIKAGRITKDEFYSWSERAREKRDKCDAGRITLEEFEAWLKQS